MEEEAAPSCDSLKLNSSEDGYSAPYLQINLYNCVSTIGGDELEFGLIATTLTKSGDFKGNVQIEDAHKVIDDSGVSGYGRNKLHDQAKP